MNTTYLKSKGLYSIVTVVYLLMLDCCIVLFNTALVLLLMFANYVVTICWYRVIADKELPVHLLCIVCTVASVGLVHCSTR